MGVVPSTILALTTLYVHNFIFYDTNSSCMTRLSMHNFAFYSKVHLLRLLRHQNSPRGIKLSLEPYVHLSQHKFALPRHIFVFLDTNSFVVAQKSLPRHNRLLWQKVVFRYIKSHFMAQIHLQQHKLTFDDIKSPPMTQMMFGDTKLSFKT